MADTITSFEQILRLTHTTFLTKCQTEDGVDFMFFQNQGGFVTSPSETADIIVLLQQFVDMVSDEEVYRSNCTLLESYNQRQSTPPAARKPRPGFVYLIHSVKSDLYKIGLSKCPEKRLYTLQLQQGTFSKLIMLHTIQTEDMYGLEQGLHGKFDAKRKHGEWFALDEADIDYVLSL